MPAEHEQVLAHSVNQADTLAQALAHADRGATGAPHAPSSQQGATSGWSPEQEQAAEVGREAAAPIVVATNEHALDAAQMAAVMTAQAGGTKSLQEAAAVAAAAAAAGNSGIAVNVTTPEAGLNSNASEQSVAAVADAVDASIEKLDLEEPQRSLLSLTWPIFIDISLHFATLIINTIMVGMVSVKAVAELTIGNQVFDLALIIFNFFNIGVCVVCAQALGANNKRLARRLIHVGLGINIIMGTLVSLGIFFCSGLIVEVMRVPPSFTRA